MSSWVLQVADVFFFAFHSAVILFNMFGWISKKWRRYHLLSLGLTLFSWFVLGIWFGWGYCICTDWHWEIRDQLGYARESNSYTHFLILKITGINLSRRLVDIGTLVVLLISVILSVTLNIRDYKAGR